MRSLPVLITLLALNAGGCARERNIYEVYAIEYASTIGRTPVQEIAVNTTSKDSVEFSFCIWYLKGANGRKVLVDAGFIADTTMPPRIPAKEYQRPDLALGRMQVRADEITDLIVTHPHYDHIGGVNLFKNATVWMQKSDYDYLTGDTWQGPEDTLVFTRDDVRKILEVNREGRLHLVTGDSVEILPGIRVFTGSMHTVGSLHVLVNTPNERVLVASDNAWFYVNITTPASIPFTLDTNAYLRQLRRMKTLVTNPDLIIPGHDAQVLSRFPQVAKGVVRIQ